MLDPFLLRGSMLDLVFDTETTGLWNNKASAQDSSQPDIVQLAAMLVEGEAVRASMNLIVIPNKPIPKEASDVHGITFEIAERCGVPANVALPMFNNLLKRADRLIAHNTEFDRNILTAAYLRYGADPSVLRQKPAICTMHSTTKLCKLPNKNPRYSDFKWPKLIEAYKILVDPAGFEGAHDAMVDVQACFKLFNFLKDNNHELVQI